MNDNPKFADLHLHTSFSDGTYSPEELVSNSLKAGLSAVAVCDHDTVEALPFCLDIGLEKGLEVIPGIELSAESDSQEIHILGYFIDYKSKTLNERLQTLNKIRVERVYKIIAKLKHMGLELDPQVVFSISGSGTVGRLHIARAMHKQGLISSVYEAFHKYIGDKGPAYVLGFKFSPEKAIRLIRDSGGVPVLAHPYVIRNDDLLRELIKKGLMGLEVYYPEHSQSMINFYLDLAQRNNLLVTGGSDCHGTAKPEVRIGSVKIPYELVEKLKEARDKL
jgi:predicted metal-dependent phosphoesterase TrpH